MRSFRTALALVSGLSSFLFAHAAPSVPPELMPRASTCNTPSNRACWTNGFNINTDYETNIPTTGVTRTYSLTITEIENWVGPDGHVKELAMLINNQYPGPVITADWGDRINITVTNHLKTNGTAIHWHGIRQLNTNLHDGANGVTECPIPPGGSKTYSFLAHQYGTTWYHSHFSAQYANGVVGTIIINGPASLPYDIDLGTFPISDYYYQTADELVDITKNAGPPPSDNVLINGTNVHPTTGAGKYANVTLTRGKRHRLRLINTSAENHFIVSLANHTMTVIETDFVPVNAMTVNSIFLGIGQRYDVTIDGSQPLGNYWFNVSFVPAGALGPPCGASVNPAPAAIFHYAGAPGGKPTNPGSVSLQTTCSDRNDYTPVVTRTVSTSAFQPNAGDTIPITLDLTQPGQLFTWKVNGSAINVDWGMPVDEYVLTGNTSYPKSENIISVNKANQWVYWLIENDPTFAIPHPIHLHGHDFVVLGKSDPNAVGLQTFNPATDMSKLNGNNPVRRDVTMLPGQGWIVIAFKTDNPGAWLMHCHIAWHVSGGLSVDFLERVADLKSAISAPDAAAFNQNCAAWRSYYPSRDPFRQHDSGLKL